MSGRNHCVKSLVFIGQGGDQSWEEGSEEPD